MLHVLLGGGIHDADGSGAAGADDVLHLHRVQHAQFLPVLDDIARQPYAHFAVPYQPPGYILLLRKYAASLANGSRKTAGLPSSMIEAV